MPIIACAYDTYMGRQLEPTTADNVRHAIKSKYSQIFGVTKYQHSKFNQYLSKETRNVYGIIPDKDWTETPFFGHPVVFFEKGQPKENTVGGYDDFAIVTDLRSVVTEDRYGETKIVDRSSFEVIKARSVTNHWWLANGTMGPLRSMPIAVAIFSEVIGETIGAAVKMELDDNIRLRIWAAIWYYMNHLDVSLPELSQNDRIGLLKFITINLRFDVDTIEQVLDAAINAYQKVLNNPAVKNSETAKDSLLHWFLLIPEACESVRLEAALKDLGVFISIVSRAHIGQMNGELMAMSFEHPPTWISLVYGAANNYSNKNSQITKITQRPIYRDGVNQLVRTLSGKISE